MFVDVTSVCPPEAEPPGAPGVGPLDGVHRLVDALLAVDASTLTDGELQDEVVRVAGEIDRLQVVLAERVVAWDRKLVWLLDGSRSAGSRLARDAHLHGGHAKRVVREAHQLAGMPSVRAAILAGTLSIDHLGVFARAASPERAGLFARDEELLVEQCTGRPHDDAARIVEYWMIRADAELAEARRARHPADQHPHPDADPRSAASGAGGDGPGAEGGAETGEPGWPGAGDGPQLDLGGAAQVRVDRLSASRTFAGALSLDGWFDDAVSAEIVIGELDRLERELYLADQAAGVVRTRSQRLAAAQVQMAQRSAAMPPDAVKARPLFVLCVGEDRARDLCQLASGRVVRVEQLAHHIDDAVMERFIFEGHTIIAGSTRRSFTGLLRQAILARDAYHCTIGRDCDVRGTRLDIDHITPAAHGGPTDQFNGRAACQPQNRHAHHRRNEPPPPRHPPRDITRADLDQARRRWRHTHGLPPDPDHPDPEPGPASAHPHTGTPRPSHRRARIPRRHPPHRDDTDHPDTGTTDPPEAA